MLTDDELEVIAEGYFHFLPITWEFFDYLVCVDDPQGILFVPELDHTLMLPVPYDDSIPDLEWDNFGIFVHRMDGAVRVITRADIQVEGLKGWEYSRDSVRRNLTRFLRGRPWWKFW